LRPADATRRDLQRLLSETVQRLRAATGCRSAVAWAVREDGTPYVAAADFEGESPCAPDLETFEAFTGLASATDLGDPRVDPGLAERARHARVRAVAPVTTLGAATLAALALDGEVAPRVLAALDEAAQQVARPLAAALAAGRLERLDDEVRRLDRLAALGSLASEIAHEVRNPLVTLQTFVELLPERREDPEFLTRYLDVVGSELRRMSRLLDRMVEHACPEAGASATLDVGDVVEGVAELVRLRASVRSVEVELVASGRGLRSSVPEDALRQALLNLALNAVDASPDGGRVRIDAREEAGRVAITVSDEGPGIPSTVRERIFEPFFTTRHERSGGLGLAITRRIIEEAGGHIEALLTTPGAHLRMSLPADGA
jgi:signal transduction histidine kinase